MDYVYFACYGGDVIKLNLSRQLIRKKDNDYQP
jgi:hypothetical protein